MLLENKVALVTGGAIGIGKAISLTFAREGCDIAICDIDKESASKTADEIRQLGRKAEVCIVDVSQTEKVAETVNKIVDSFTRIDILVNNAGITRDNLIVRMSEADWDSVINVNVKGCFNFTKAVTRFMMKQRSGKIISIASIVGLMGNAGQANYSASKAAVVGFTKSIAKELASRGINVNAIAPGFIKTRMTDKLTDKQKQAMLEQIPFNAFGEPDDVAKTALFLASDLSNYITGQVITVDGGMLM